jgi:hypothetical protein
MNAPELNPWVVYLIGLITLGKLVWELFTKPGSKAQEAVDRLKDDVAKKADKTEVDRALTKVDGVEERLAVIESEIEHLPDRETTHAMELAFRDLKGEVAVLVERIGPIAKTSERLQEFLLSQGR